MKLGRIVKEVEIPEKTSVNFYKQRLTVRGALGELSRDFSHTNVEIKPSYTGNVLLTAYFPNRKEKAVVGTVAAHIKNMIDGVNRGFRYKMKIVFSHFPIRVTPDMKNKVVKIENLYGGRRPKYAKIIGETKVIVEEDDVIVEGINKEDVGQTCANIQELTRLRGKKRQSPKTFMDGIYVYSKGYQKE